MATVSHKDIFHLKDEFHRIHPVFLKFTDQMESRCKDGYGKSVRYIPLKGSILQNLLPLK